MPLQNNDPFAANPPLPIERLKEIVTALLKAGHQPIPVLSGSKRPVHKGWSSMPVDLDVIETWPEEYPEALSTGIRNTPAADIDVYDNAEVADRIEQALLNMIPHRGTILKRVGKPPKRLIPFRAETPFSKMAVKFGLPGEGGEAPARGIEWLHLGQQFLVEGIHPETHMPYTWSNNVSLLNVAREHLPLIDEATARRFLEEATRIMLEAGYVQVSGGGNGKHKPNGKAASATYTPQPGDDERIAGALAFIDASDRDTWIQIGMALHAHLGEAGRDVWRRWSATCPEKYDSADADRVWASFGRKTGVTIATLFLRAIQGGWNREPEGNEESPAAGGSRSAEKRAPPAPCSLDDLHCVFRKWFGEEYDLDAIDAVVAAAAAERLDGDPLWLLIVSGPGAAKTETVQALSGCGAHITSTIQSEGALLSATSQHGRSKKATGGLLRKVGARGILVIKDMTTILSSDRNTRGTVLAALREVYDGRWERNVGTDGGQTLTWEGRIVVVGAVTTAWDTAHAVIATMGDRFVILRINSDFGREASGIRSIRNTGSEVQMRRELADAVGGLVVHARSDVPPLTLPETRQLVKAANIVTMNRTAVERDYQGNVVDAHAPEMPTRFAKQLAQMLRGGIAVGMSRERAMELAIRCARDSIPPLRREILLDVAANPDTNPGDVRKRLNKPWTTVKREMEGLNMLGTLHCDEDTIRGYGGGKDKTVWRYRLAPEFDRTTLLAMAGVREPSPEK